MLTYRDLEFDITNHYRLCWMFSFYGYSFELDLLPPSCELLSEVFFLCVDVELELLSSAVFCGDWTLLIAVESHLPRLLLQHPIEHSLVHLLDGSFHSYNLLCLCLLQMHKP